MTRPPETAPAPVGHNSNTFYLGLEPIEVWPAGQRLQSIDRSIKITRFTDVEAYHGPLIERILEEEQRLRREQPAQSRCLGGQKVRHPDLWGMPEFDLLHARAKELFRRTIGCAGAAVDACWTNVYRQWDSIGPHSHRRATASLLYCLDQGEEDPQDPLSGRFSICDPRLELCCKLEKGHMTNPFYPVLEPGTMLIFPGSVLHAVSAYSGIRPRITVTWNINPEPLPGSVKDVLDPGGRA